MKHWLCKLLGHRFFQADNFGSILVLYCDRCGENKCTFIPLSGKKEEIT